jgi:hypothetical protein
MFKCLKNIIILVLTLLTVNAINIGCGGKENIIDLKGATSYTPYDALAMFWCREGKERKIIWTGSGGESGKLLVSKAKSSDRPDWVLCTQGVVAGLAAKGEKITIIASVYQSDKTILPVYRKGLSDFRGTRSLFIPRSSNEFAFDKFLSSKNISRSDLKIPTVENVNFNTIVSLLKKDDKDAIDFGVLVDPFITNIMGEKAGQFEIGEGGLYDMDYCVVVRENDLIQNPESFVRLMKQLLAAEARFQLAYKQGTLNNELWGRLKDGKPDLLPKLITYSPTPSQIHLNVKQLKDKMKAEIEYLVNHYPRDLQKPENGVDAIISPNALLKVAPERVNLN